MLKLIGSMKNEFGGIKSFLKAQFVSTILNSTSQDKCFAGDTTKKLPIQNALSLDTLPYLRGIFWRYFALCKIKCRFFLIFSSILHILACLSYFCSYFCQFLLSRIFVFSRFKLYQITNPSQFVLYHLPGFASNLKMFSNINTIIFVVVIKHIFFS